MPEYHRDLGVGFFKLGLVSNYASYASANTTFFSLFIFVFQNKIPGVGFLKIHAPWEVLCREAEFMKLKMPTFKVFVLVSYHVIKTICVFYTSMMYSAVLSFLF